MKNTSFIFPYPIGTYLVKKENGKEHLDQVYEYIISKNGMFVILMLDIIKQPRLSTRIDINTLIQNWEKYDNNTLENEKTIESGPIKKLMKKEN